MTEVKDINATIALSVMGGAYGAVEAAEWIPPELMEGLGYVTAGAVYAVPLFFAGMIADSLDTGSNAKMAVMLLTALTIRSGVHTMLKNDGHLDKPDHVENTLGVPVQTALVQWNENVTPEEMVIRPMVPALAA